MTFLLPLIFTCIFLMASYVFVQFGHLEHLQGYFGSYLLALFSLFMIAVELTRSLTGKVEPEILMSPSRRNR